MIAIHKNAHLYEGSVYSTDSGDLKILKYENSSKVHIEFLKTGYKKVVQFVSIKKGNIRDRLLPTVHGVGILGYETTKVGGVQPKEYELWSGMLERCYSSKSLKSFPTYSQCTVSDNFKHYTYFKEWCSKQKGFNVKDHNGKHFHLDKDILLKGNKIYNEDTCVFVPVEINLLFTKATKNRGNLPVGVNYHNATGKYQARSCIGSGRKYLGVFDTEEEAFHAYKEAKETYIKEVANKWKDQIDSRVYEALINYKVEITD